MFISVCTLLPIGNSRTFHDPPVIKMEESRLKSSIVTFEWKPHHEMPIVNLEPVLNSRHASSWSFFHQSSDFTKYIFLKNYCLKIKFEERIHFFTTFRALNCLKTKTQVFKDFPVFEIKNHISRTFQEAYKPRVYFSYQTMRDHTINYQKQKPLPGVKWTKPGSSVTCPWQINPRTKSLCCSAIFTHAVNNTIFLS